MAIRDPPTATLNARATPRDDVKCSSLKHGLPALGLGAAMVDVPAAETDLVWCPNQTLSTQPAT
jgi:hypothetical protein